MAAASPAATSASKPGSTARKRLVTLIVGTAVWSGILFACAGRLDWFRGWFYVGLSVTSYAVTAIVIRRFNPELVKHRGGIHADTKRFDRVITLLYSVLLLAFAAVAGLDAGRFGWSPLGTALVYPGIALFVAGFLAVLWSMAVNPFLETTVRIQTDRGHRVVTSGPYAVVRHPMYVGIILQTLSAPLVLGSGWAYVPAGLVAAVFIVRTALEDRTLRNELAGYEEFARRTRYRLVPGIW